MLVIGQSAPEGDLHQPDRANAYAAGCGWCRRSCRERLWSAKDRRYGAVEPADANPRAPELQGPSGSFICSAISDTKPNASGCRYSIGAREQRWIRGGEVMGTFLPPTTPLPSILRGRMIALEVDQITHQALQCRHSRPLQACASFWPGPVPEPPHWSASITGQQSQLLSSS